MINVMWSAAGVVWVLAGFALVGGIEWLFIRYGYKAWLRGPLVFILLALLWPLVVIAFLVWFIVSLLIEGVRLLLWKIQMSAGDHTGEN